MFIVKKLEHLYKHNKKLYSQYG